MVPEIVERLKPYPYALPLSFSKGNTLNTCPKKYDLQYIQKASKTPAPHKEVMIVGKFAHKVLEFCMNKAQSFGWHPDAVDFGGTWMQVHRQMNMPLKEYDMAEELRIPTEKVFHKILSAIESYKLRVHPEMMICMDLTGQVRPSVKWPHRFFYGYVDFVGVTRSGKKALIIDYKSHSGDKDNREKTALQLSNYAHCLLIKNPDLKSVQYGGAYLPDETVDLSDPVERDSDEHIKLQEDIRAFYENYIAALEAGQFDPMPSELCDWCEFTHICP